MTRSNVNPAHARDIDRFENARPSSNGERILLDLAIEGQVETLGLPVSEALNLAFSTLGCEAACRMIKNSEDVGTALTAVEAYQLGVDNDGAPIVTFTGPTGGRLSFAFKLEQLDPFRAELDDLIASFPNERTTR